MTASGRLPNDLHERARMLASMSIDEPLDPGDAAWLDEHLAGCAACRTVADDFRSIHEELHALAAPVPPRDLWAATSARLDQVDRARSGRGFRMLQGLGRSSPSLLGSAIAVAAVVVLVGVSVFSHRESGVPNPSSAAGSEFAIASTKPEPPPAAAGRDKVAWVAAPSNGSSEILAGGAECRDNASACTLGSVSGKPIATIQGPVAGVALDASAQQVVVWTKDRVVIMPASTGSQVPVAIGSLSPPPATPVPTATSQVVASPTPTPTASPAGSSPRSSATATKSVAPSASPTPSPPPTASPTPNVPPTSAPTAPATPVAILDGYTVAGRSDFSPDGQWLAFAAAPADKSSGPDIFVWQRGDSTAHPITSNHAAVFSGWWRNQILFSEFDRPAAGAGGPGGPSASASSSASATVSASASANAAPSPGASATESSAAPVFGPDAPAVTPVATSYMIDPATGTEQRIVLPMLQPAVDPTGRYVVYWAGTLRPDATAHLWTPSAGDLYFLTTSELQMVPVAPSAGTPAVPAASGQAASSPSPSASGDSSAAPTATSSASPSGTGAPAPSQGAAGASPAASLSASAAPSAVAPELLPVTNPGSVTRWEVRWDPTGQFVGVWVAGDASGNVGRLSVYHIDTTVGRVDSDAPVIATQAVAGFQITETSVVYASPANGGDGKTHVVSWPQLPPPSAPTPSATNDPVAPTISDAPGG